MSILQVTNLRKEFGPLVAVKDVTFTVERGQVIGLIGPNGAGKTTLLRMIATLLPTTSGRIELMGMDTARDYLAVRGRIGYLPDFFNLYNDLTLEECMDFFGRAYKMDPDVIPGRVDQVLKYIDLENRRKSFIRSLSRGMVQRLGVGALLMHDPEVFLLDEPASGLDPKARVQLRATLKKLTAGGATVIISSHILTELSGFCTHIALMNEGDMVVFGNVDEIERKIAGSRKLVISLLNRCEDAVSIVKGIDSVEVLEVKDDTISCDTTADAEGLAAINSRLVSNGIKVVNFYEEKTNLEDLFMKVSAAAEQPAAGRTGGDTGA